MKRPQLILLASLTLGGLALCCLNSCRRPPAPRNGAKYKLNTNAKPNNTPPPPSSSTKPKG